MQVICFEIHLHDSCPWVVKSTLFVPEHPHPHTHTHHIPGPHSVFLLHRKNPFWLSIIKEGFETLGAPQENGCHILVERAGRARRDEDQSYPTELNVRPHHYPDDSHALSWTEQNMLLSALNMTFGHTHTHTHTHTVLAEDIWSGRALLNYEETYSSHSLAVSR